MTWTIPLSDTLAFVWFVLGWTGFTLYADRRHRSGGVTLLSTMKKHRRAWMQRMLERENRVVDGMVTSTLMRSVSLFASTTIFILAGLLTILGATDKVQDVILALPFAAGETTRALWEFKVLVMVTIFIYAFFKFAWSIRQFNYAIVLVAAAPMPQDADTDEARSLADTAAQVMSLAVHSFNLGIRAYYFGLGALAWFVHPVAFAVAILWVVSVLYRREFMSRTLRALSGTLP